METEVPEMGTAENVELVRRGYEAFNAGDMATPVSYTHLTLPTN